MRDKSWLAAGRRKVSVMEKEVMFILCGLKMTLERNLKTESLDPVALTHLTGVGVSTRVQRAASWLYPHDNINDMFGI